MTYLFYIRCDCSARTEYGEQLAMRFEPYAYTYEKKLAKLFTKQRCKTVFRMKKSHGTPKAFADEMRLLEIPLNDHTGGEMEIVGTVQEESILEYAFQLTADKIYDMQSKVEEYLIDGILNDYGYNDIMEYLWIDAVGEEDTPAITRINTYHLFYDVFSRTFIDPDAWDQLAPDPIPKLRYIKPYEDSYELPFK